MFEEKPQNQSAIKRFFASFVSHCISWHRVIPVVALCVVFDTGAFESVVLISDIDDTLKASDIIGLTHAGFSDAKRKSAALKSCANSRNSFTGLSLLYTAFACFGVATQDRASCHQFRAHNRGAERMVFYVTGAPNKLAGFPLRFLLNSRFPVGPVSPRENTDVSTLEHKVAAITKIIEHLPAATIILVGDNGEHDTQVFAQIQSRFAGRSARYKIHAFVHYVASPEDIKESLKGAPIETDQHVFVTAADLAVQFLTAGWINQESADEVVASVAKALSDKDDRLAVIPVWMNCRGFDSSTTDWAGLPEYPEITRSVEDRCRTGSFPDF